RRRPQVQNQVQRRPGVHGTRHLARRRRPVEDRRPADGAVTMGEMTAEEFMRNHADKASSGRIGEILGDLTPEAMTQVMPLMADGPNPPTGNTVVARGRDGDDY